MELNRVNVLEVLGGITEPELKKDIVTLNLVEGLELGDHSISLTVYVSNPALHARKRMQEAIDFNLKRRELVDIYEYQRNISYVHFTTIV